jgi:hypothetical protein
MICGRRLGAFVGAGAPVPHREHRSRKLPMTVSGGRPSCCRAMSVDRRHVGQVARRCVYPPARAWASVRPAQ